MSTATALIASPAFASDTTVLADNYQGPIETVVVTGSNFNADVAPAKASLNTTQPQTIINKSYIEDSIAATADYTTILAIVPSLTGQSINGPGLSDGNVKNTLRGLPDGQFGLSYDGIPFGDTNGPTHHSESYFPSSTIGGAIVDRGPGNAGTLGASTYGGTINLFSEPLAGDFHVRQTATYGSWNTWNVNTNVQSGNLDLLGFTTRVLANYQGTGSEGYLTLQSTHRENELLKIETDIAPNWTLTLFGSRNGLSQIVNDANGATPAQIVTYGKNFALQNTNRALPTYFAYNPEHKDTDMEYLRLKGDVTSTLHLDDQAYTYAYVNKSVSTTNIQQKLSDILANTGQGLGTIVGGVPHSTDIPGYTKLNTYRVWGNIFRASFDYDFGSVTGQLRTGLWWESSATERQRYYFDATLCNAPGNAPCDAFGTERSGVFADSKTSSGSPFDGVPGIGYFEHTGWTQYQPFLELDIQPFEGLTITPGVKYISWDHTIDPDSLIKGKPPKVYNAANPGSFKTTRTLQFATVNYKLLQNWAVYAQYANGIYVPDISAFEVTAPIGSFPKPQTTTNYQIGTVYYGDNFSIDGDYYYIQSDNTIQLVTCPDIPAETCNINAGAVFYKGIEGEATYAFDDSTFDGMLNGLVLFANGSLNSAKGHLIATDDTTPNYQVQQAPFWTAAMGVIYKHDRWKLSLIDKLTGQQYQDTPAKRVDANGLTPDQRGYAGSFYKLPAYNNMDFTGSYDLGDWGTGVDFEIGGGIYNILNSRSILAITINDKANTLAGQGAAEDIAGRMSSLDQYYFQPERSYQITIKARL
jgi:iron complex outermembrane receptor protein